MIPSRHVLQFVQRNRITFTASYCIPLLHSVIESSVISCATLCSRATHVLVHPHIWVPKKAFMFLHSIRTLRTAVQHPVPATCPVHFMSLDLLIQTKSGAGTNHDVPLPLRSYLHYLVTCPVLSTNFLPRILSQTPASLSEMSILRQNFSVPVMQHLLSACGSPVYTLLASPC